jgi:Undecaprenyl-phosphate galactose phosphotransferase WbaP
MGVTQSRMSAKLALIFTYLSIFLSDLIALSIAGLAAVLIRHFFHGQFHSADYLSFYPGVAVLITAFAIGGLYPSFGTSPIDEFRLILRSSAAGFLALAGATYLFREAAFSSRSVFLMAWLFTVLLVPFARRIARGFFSRQAWWGIPVVIFSEDAAGTMMLDLLQGHKRLGLRPVALLSATPQPDGIHSVRRPIVHDDLSTGAAAARRHPGAYALLAMPNADSHEIARTFRENCRDFRNVLIIPAMFGLRTLSVSASDIGGVLALRVQQNLTDWFSSATKRCFDLVLCALLAIPFLPLFFLLYLAVRFTSKGPALYSHARIGKDGRVFHVRKLRSMVVDAESILAEALKRDSALQDEWNRDHKLKQDPRVTWIGRFIRKTSLDEIPQLWNVICGEMSLVGPRPIVHSEIPKYGGCYQLYILVRPGITGLWQVSGRNNTSYELRTRIDDYYIRNWSVSMDFYILFRTVKTLLLREGAY